MLRLRFVVLSVFLFGKKWLFVLCDSMNEMHQSRFHKTENVGIALITQYPDEFDNLRANCN